MLKKIGLLLAVLALALAGLLLTSGKSRFAAASERLLSHPPEAVWSQLSAVEHWPQWWPGVEQARLEPGWQVGAHLHLALQGDPERIPARVEALVPGRELAWSRPGVLGSRTRLQLRLEPAAEGTRVRLASEVVGPQAVLARWTAQEDFQRYQELVLAKLEESLQATPPSQERGTDE